MALEDELLELEAGNPDDPNEPVEPDPAAYGLCDELYAGRRGTPFSTNLHRNYIRRWRVGMLDPLYGPVAVCKHPLLPYPYAPYVSASGVESDFAARLIDLTAEQEHDDDWQTWIVTGQYSTAVNEAGINLETGAPDSHIGPQNNPEQERPVIEWDAEEATETPQTDLDGEPFATSAGQPFSPPYTSPIAWPVLVITRNMRRFDDILVSKYAYAVNADLFLNNPPGTCQCLPPRAKVEHRGGISYYRTSWRVRIRTTEYLDETDPDGPVVRRETWQPQVLDQGTYRLATLAGAPLEGYPVPIVHNGQPVSQPVLLDGAGRPLKRDPADNRFHPVYRKFRRFRAENLNDLFGNLVLP